MCWYVPVTPQRHALTRRFPLPEEGSPLHELISAYLQRDFSYGFPSRQKHLVRLIFCKPGFVHRAVVYRLDAIRTGCSALLDKQTIDEEWIQQLIEDEDLDEDLLEDDDPPAPQPTVRRRWTTPWCAKSWLRAGRIPTLPATFAKTKVPCAAVRAATGL